jgi:multicomponent Na+:H+ antiporter subunit D
MIIETYETRDIREIRGVFKRMPFVSIITVMAVFGITGAPLFNGSISKYLIGSGTHASELLEYGLLLINLGTVMSFVKYLTMFGGHSDKAKVKVPLNQKVAISILGTLCLLGGILGVQFIKFLFNIDIYVSLEGYLHKTIQYLISLIIGWLFYHYLYKRIHFFKKIREIELTFNQICFTIVFFFAGMFGYLSVIL